MFGPYGYGPYGSGWGWMLGGWIMMVVFWGLVIAGIVAFIKAVRRPSTPLPQQRPGSPADILARRYATGEITKEQYEAMKRDLAA